MPTDFLAAYDAAIALLGYGLHTDRALRHVGGLTWRQIHALTDAGIIRAVAVYGSQVQYRCLFS